MSAGSCQARYATGEFAGMRCIERAKETRHGLGLCRTHAKVFDRWLKFGFDYVRSIVRLEWQQEIAAANCQPPTNPLPPERR